MTGKANRPLMHFRMTSPSYRQMIGTRVGVTRTQGVMRKPGRYSLPRRRRQTERPFAALEPRKSAHDNEGRNSSRIRDALFLRTASAEKALPQRFRGAHEWATRFRPMARISPDKNSRFRPEKTGTESPLASSHAGQLKIPTDASTSNPASVRSPSTSRRQK